MEQDKAERHTIDIHEGIIRHQVEGKSYAQRDGTRSSVDEYDNIFETPLRMRKACKGADYLARGSPPLQARASKSPGRLAQKA